MTAKEILQKALDKLENGAAWTHGVETKLVNGKQKYCAVGAIRAAQVGLFSDKVDRDISEKVDREISKAVLLAILNQGVAADDFFSLTEFNDGASNFYQIKQFFEDAIERCPE
jgi:hypothetical protein